MVWGLRRDVNFLLSEGHAEAEFYPVCFLWAEVQLARERVNRMLASQMLLTQSAIASIFTKKSVQDFGEAIERLTD